MDNQFSSLGEYDKVIERNQITYSDHSILVCCNQQCFENKNQLLDFMLFGCEEDKKQREKYIESIDYCFAKEWIQYLNNSDVAFDQFCLDDDPLSLQGLLPYVENNIGLSFAGALFFNSLELQINEMYNQRHYEDIVSYKFFESNLIILQGLYTDVVKNKLDEQMDLIYFKQKKLLGKNIEISYVDPYEVGHWYPRRYIKLCKGYRGELFYEIL